MARSNNSHRGGNRSQLAGARQPKRKKVVLTFDGQPGRDVYVAGTFNRWDTRKKKMREESPGRFSITMMLPVGEHEYKFFSDGEWFEDRTGIDFRANRFGTRNNVIRL